MLYFPPLTIAIMGLFLYFMHMTPKTKESNIESDPKELDPNLNNRNYILNTNGRQV